MIITIVAAILEQFGMLKGFLQQWQRFGAKVLNQQIR